MSLMNPLRTYLGAHSGEPALVDVGISSSLGSLPLAQVSSELLHFTRRCHEPGKKKQLLASWYLQASDLNASKVTCCFSADDVSGP